MSTCNNNCNQGRYCDCIKDDQLINCWKREVVTVILLCCFCGFVGFAIGLAS